MLLLPWHLYDPLPTGLNVTLPAGTVELDGRFGVTGSPWRDLIGVYAPLADEVARDAGPTVVLSGDCVASLAVLAGVQRRGVRPSLVWFDAHGDFHTEASTTSGYLGGLPLAKAVGRGDLILPEAFGLTSLGEESVTLVDGRDLDPAEAEALAGSKVTHVSVAELDTDRLPEGPMVAPRRRRHHRPRRAGRPSLPCTRRTVPSRRRRCRARRRARSAAGRARHRCHLAARGHHEGADRRRPFRASLEHPTPSVAPASSGHGHERATAFRDRGRSPYPHVTNRARPPLVLLCDGDLLRRLDFALCHRGAYLEHPVLVARLYVGLQGSHGNRELAME